MFSKVVPVNEITSHDHQDFYDKNPMMRLIGVNVDPDTGEEIETKRYVIHYGKKGTHIVPTKELKK